MRRKNLSPSTEIEFRASKHSKTQFFPKMLTEKNSSPVTDALLKVAEVHRKMVVTKSKFSLQKHEIHNLLFEKYIMTHTFSKWKHVEKFFREKIEKKHGNMLCNIMEDFVKSKRELLQN